MKTGKTTPSTSLRSLCVFLVVHFSTSRKPHSPRLVSGALFSVFKLRQSAGFTLIETLVAITLLTVAITEPISLTTQSLQSAYYARDQITSFYLAQEAIEALRSARDAQILRITQTANASGINIFDPDVIPLGDTPFRIDATQTDSTRAITRCSNDPGGVCIPLQTNGTLYGYQSGWTPTNFTRTIKAHFVGSGQDEVRVTVTVTWRTGAFQTRSFSISENLYRWVQDGSGATS